MSDTTTCRYCGEEPSDWYSRPNRVCAATACVAEYRQQLQEARQEAAPDEYDAQDHTD